jgi:hypothetical protein
LNLSEVDYISSAGIGVLLKFRKQLQALGGAFSITKPSDAVAEILKVLRLELLFAAPAVAEAAQPTKVREEKRVIALSNARLEVYPPQAAASLSCRAIGDPDALLKMGFKENDCARMSLPPNAFAIGIGALGRDFADCQARFGEFIAVGGAVAYQPTDKRSVPDYLLATENFIPELQMLYGLFCQGEFSHMVTFEAKPDSNVSLAELVPQCLELLKSDTAGLVIAAEVSGLVGAALKRSPASAEAGGSLFRHPEVRNWMTFTTEPAYARCVAVIAGVVSRKENKALGPMIRPLGGRDWPRGHFHAAAFTYRPLRKGRIDLSNEVRTLFEEERLLGILHLLNDPRPIEGAGQSEFVRGICWIAPISNVVSERK